MPSRPIPLSFVPPNGINVEAVVGRIVHHHAADVESADSLERRPEVLGEDRRMETVVDLVRAGDRLPSVPTR